MQCILNVLKNNKELVIFEYWLIGKVIGRLFKWLIDGFFGLIF